MARLNFSQLESLQDDRRAEAQEIMEFYEGDLDGIKTQIQALFSKRTVIDFATEIPWVPINFLESIVDQLAALYAEPPVRSLKAPDLPPGSNGEDVSEELLKQHSDASKALQALLAEALEGSGINEACQTALEQCWLFNTAIVGPHWIRDKEKLGFGVYNSADTVVLSDTGDHKKIALIAYRRNEFLADGVIEDTAYYVWTDTEHYRVSTHTPTPHAVGNNKEMVNPYKTLDIFAVLRIKDKRKFYGPASTDLWYANREIIFQNGLLLRNAMWQGFSIPFSVNCGFGKTKYDADTGKPLPGAKIGPGQPVEVDNVKSDDYPPDFRFVTPAPLLEEIIGVIEALLKMVGIRYRFDARKMALAMVSQTEESGIAKAFDAGALEEIRNRIVGPARAFENDLYRAVVIVNNLHSKTDLPEDGFLVDFADVQVKRTDKEIREDREFRLGKHLTTVPEIMLEDNPDLETLAAAEAKWKQNKILNDQMLFGFEDDPEDDDDNPPEGGDE